MAKKKDKKEPPKNEKIPKSNPIIDGILLFSFAFIMSLSLLSFAYGTGMRNSLGLIGYNIGWIFHAFFGVPSYFISLFIAWIGWRKMFSKPITNLSVKVFWFAIAIISSCFLFSLIEDNTNYIASGIKWTFYPSLLKDNFYYHLGGMPFYYIYKDLPFFNLDHLVNTVGVFIIFSTTLIASLLFLFKIHPMQIYEILKKIIASMQIPNLKKPSQEALSTAGASSKIDKEMPQSDFMRYVKLRIPNTQQQAETQPSLQLPFNSGELLAIQPETNLKVRPSLSRKEKIIEDVQVDEIAPIPSLSKPISSTESLAQKKRANAIKAQQVYNGDFKEFNLPSSNLLSNPKKIDQTNLKKDLKRQAEVLEETLLSFGIEAKVGQINCGPTITSFEVHPAIGVKVQRIKTLENDIALNMEAKSIRIIAPIPGKAAVGIEVPNPQPQEVAFKDMLQAYQQGTRKFQIPILLGKAVNGDYVMSDLAKMPHCIIAGATGSGKSVCINTIVMSIVMNAKPDEIRLIMVDPKKVELTGYSALPHMLAPVITEAQGACAALNWMVKEMEKRYEILKHAGLRNIEAFNNRTIDKETEEALPIDIPEKLPFIVGIIDELADLMMVSSSDIETPIARIAQMARAVGIHLILATQRPSREVITGLIKANFPTRISFKVASRVNSQIVLDEVGAETLLGNGDMLFLPPGSSHLVRAQGAFIRDDDIHAIVDMVCKQAPPNYEIESFDTYSPSNDYDTFQEELPLDVLFDQAKDVVLSTGNASTTFLQRKLKIGYARAASLMDQLELKGIVGPAEGSKARKILGIVKKNPAERDFLDEFEE
ncbi:MAG: cell division protein FtsK [Chlamydia sp. 32-24]|nr:MAG: cell division protein FtsK [Chlamydia sp. 32-24]